MEALKILLIYFVSVNLLSLLSFGSDKGRARRNRWRISEGSLLALALFGGCIGALLGMWIFHHKTAKPKFFIGVPAILVLQIVIVAAILIFRPFDLSFM